MRYEIWQLPISHNNCFRGFDVVTEPIIIRDYVHVYQGNIDSCNLESIFEKLNIDHPADYYARSLSVSDIICLINDNDRDYYYVDSTGFRKLSKTELRMW